MFIKVLEYETANPDQDGTGNVEKHFEPPSGKEITHAMDDDPDKFNNTTTCEPSWTGQRSHHQ